MIPLGTDSRTVQLAGLRGADKSNRFVDAVWASIKARGSLLVIACSRSVANEGASPMHGIPMGRCFTVAGAVESGCVKLIQLVDPMVSRLQSEWVGPYSASSDTWTPELRRATAKVAVEGGFWMSFGDFVGVFGTLETCTALCTAQEGRINTSLKEFSGDDCHLFVHPSCRLGRALKSTHTLP